MGYLLPFWIYARIPQASFYRPGMGANSEGPWWSGVQWSIRNQGPWVGRAWPGTRIFVFAMGCLSALNRLDAEASQTHQAEPQPSGSAHKETLDKQPTGLEGGDACSHLMRTSEGSDANRGHVVVIGRGGFDMDCSCRLGPRSDDPVERWSCHTDTLLGIYLVVIVAQILVSNLYSPIHVLVMEAGLSAYGQPIQGRAIAEAMVPMLELGLIVSLTYDSGSSWTARFCNTRAVRTLGDVSMSFYMAHMIVMQQLMQHEWARSPAEPPSSTCPQEHWQLCSTGNWDGPSPDPDRWPTPQQYCHACVMAWMGAGGNPNPTRLRWWAVLVILAICVGVGWVLTRYVELPAQALLRRGWKWTPFPTPAACGKWLGGEAVPSFLPHELRIVFAACTQMCGCGRLRHSVLDSTALLA